MARKLTRTARVFRGIALLATLPILLGAIAALAQIKAGQPFGRPPTVPVLPSISASSFAQDAPKVNGGTGAGRVPLRPTGQGFSPSATAPANSLFLPPATYDTGADNPVSVVIADVNGDGKPDLVIANQCTGPDFCGGAPGPGAVSVLIGRGDGSFQPAVTYAPGGSILYSVAVADVNGDGIPDLVTANGCANVGGGFCSAEGLVGVLLGNGDGTFQQAHTYASGGFDYYKAAVVVADVNRDGKPDLLVMNVCATPCDTIFPPDGSVSVLLGKGDGTFQTAVTYSSGGIFPGSITVADLNGDGKLDLVVPNLCGSNVSVGSCSPGLVGVLLGNGDGTFQPAVVYDAGGADARVVAVADVSSDGKPDLLVADCGPGGCGGGSSGVVAVLLGRGDGTFQSAVTYGSGSFVSISAADLDADGKLDILAANWTGSNQGGGVDVMLGNGDGTFQNATTYDSGTGPMALAVADVNGDGGLDLVTTHGFGNGLALPPGTVDVLLNNRGSNQTPTTTTLASSPNPSIFGQTITFTAAVSASSGTPTGTVTFFDGPTALGTATLVSGSTSISVSALTVGSHSITAAYQGSSVFRPSTSQVLNQVVNTSTPGTTITSLVSSKNPVIINQFVTYTASVANQSGGPVTGTVTFRDGTATIATITLSGNQAAYRTSYRTIGVHPITAAYSGDANNQGSTSATLREAVEYPSHTVVATSGSPSLIDQPVTFTATVTSSNHGTIPDGELVTFADGKTPLAAVALSSGTAAYVTSTLSARTHYIKATYAGDATFEPSTGTVKQVVMKYPTTTVLISSPNPSAYGQAVTFTATVTGAGPSPTGKVWFKDGTTGIGTVALSGGVATLTKSKLAAGTHPITAEYLGDAASNKSTSSVLNQVVQ